MTHQPEFGRVYLEMRTETADFQTAMDEAQARYDDRAWSYYVMQPFTWQRFTNWWIARRWVMPRDIRRR